MSPLRFTHRLGALNMNVKVCAGGADVMSGHDAWMFALTVEKIKKHQTCEYPKYSSASHLFRLDPQVP